MAPRMLPFILLAAGAQLASAGPYPRDDLHDLGYSYLMPRQCAAYCGSENQYCCSQGQYCTTLPGDVATCAGGGPGGGYGYLTTTWTRTYTSTIATYYEPAPEPTAGVDCIPKNDDQEACGGICCAGWQTCAFLGQCSAKPGYDEPSTIIITQSDGAITTQYSAPYRVTITSTITSSEAATGTTGTADEATATETNDNGESSGTAGGGGGLSAGAIAGIVIGSLAGVVLLILLCFCCIVRGLWKTFFGRKDHKDKEYVTEERYSRHGSRHSGRTKHSGWFGGRPSSAGDRREKKKSNGKWWLGLAGAAATFLALLNLKGKKKKPAKSAGGRSRYSDSYYSYSDATRTNPSSSSSGARSHYTRRTRDDRSRGPPRSQYTQGSRRS